MAGKICRIIVKIFLVTCRNYKMQNTGETALSFYKRIHIHHSAKSDCKGMMKFFTNDFAGASLTI